MAGNASIVVDIKAQITGYEELIAKIKEAMKKVDPGSAMGKSLMKTLEQADLKLTSLLRKAELRITSLGQLEHLFDLLHSVHDLVQNVSNSMQNIGVNDVLESSSERARELGKELSNVKTEMLTNGQTFFDSFKGAEFNKLLDIFNLLSFDPKLMNIDTFVLSFKLATQEAKAEVDDLTQKQKEALSDLDRARSMSSIRDRLPAALQGKDVSKDSLRAALGLDGKTGGSSIAELMNNSLIAAEEFINRVREGVNNDETRSQSNKDALAGLLLSSLTLLLLARTEALVRDILTTLDKSLRYTKDEGHKGSHAGIAGTYGQGINAELISKLTLNTYKADLEFIDYVTQLKDLLMQSKDSDANAAGVHVGNLLLELAQPSDLNTFNSNIDTIVNALREGLKKVNTAKEDFNVGEKETVNEGVKAAKVTAEEKLTKLENLANTLLYQAMIAEYERLQNRMSVIEEALGLEKTKGKEGTAEEVRGAGRKALENLKPLGGQGALELLQYSSMLEDVLLRQLALGKVEGIAQRWFSVYAAVRMIGKAFRSVKLNITGLDKTITDIAIVTDKSQSDLWGQMPQYTAMATKYGASLLGVYEVSLLYYQQGLEQNDVMALTEQTLKMARISGLDYADATNYMTNAIRSFKIDMQDALRVVDVYSALAASSASSTTELATAMSKTASSAAAVGSSFENTSAMMAVMIETTRESPENIGSALKSIISRYGELKENKTGIDEEGEEYSLNKVDTALLSVGISIHDAKGEFRDFDDVIMELSQSWDTIDKNTQRYIATVMAGNRQQSRFLALVSNGERLTELAETAETSEDASTLQVLKTMDSIDYKALTLLTTLQSLYTSTGVETFYKGILDGANLLVSTFADMPTMFSLPIPAIALLGTSFVTAANLVMTTLHVMRQKFLAQWKADSSDLTANEAAENLKRLANQLAADQASLLEHKTTTELKQATTTKAGGMTKYSKIGLGLGFAGLAASATAGFLGDKTNTERGWKGVLGTLGSGLQGTGIGLLLGGPTGAVIGGILGSLSGLLSNILYFWLDATAYAERLKKDAEEALTEFKLKNATANSLEKEIDKLKELEDASNDSTEARERFLEASNKIAEDNAALVDHYDIEGNAILNLANAYEVLKEKRDEANKSAENSAIASGNAAEAAVAAAENEYKNQLVENYLGKGKAVDAKDTKNLLLFTKFAGRNTAVGYEYTPDELDFSEIASNIMDKEISTNAAARDAINKQNYLKWLMDNLANGPEGMKEIATNMAILGDTLEDLWAKELKNISDDTTRNALSYIIDRIKLGSTDLVEYEGKVQSTRAALDKTYRSEIAKLILAEVGEQRLLSKYGKEDLAGKAEADLLMEVMEGIDSASEMFTDYVMAEWGTARAEGESWENFVKRMRKPGGPIQEFIGNLVDIPESAYDEVNEVYKKRGQLTKALFKDEMKHALAGRKNTDKIIDSTLAYYKDAFTATDFTKAVGNVKRSKYSIKTDFDNVLNLEELGDLELQSLLTVYDLINKMYTNGNISMSNAAKLLSNYVSMWKLTQNEDIVPDSELREIMQNLLMGLTDFTEEGLKEFSKLVEESNLTLENQDLVNNEAKKIAGLLSENLNTIINNYQENMVTATKEYGSALSKATKGMSYEDAAKMAKDLNIDFTADNFNLDEGLATLKDTSLLWKKYFGENGISELVNLLIANTKEAIINDSDYLSTLASAAKLGSVEQVLRGRAKTLNLDYNTLNLFIQDFNASEETDIAKYAETYFEDRLKGIQKFTADYIQSTQLKSAMDSGKLKDIARAALPKEASDATVESISTLLLTALQTGTFDTIINNKFISDELKGALPKLKADYDSALSSVISSLVSGLDKGFSYIEGNQWNLDLLTDLAKKGVISLLAGVNGLNNAIITGTTELILEVIEDYDTPKGLAELGMTQDELNQLINSLRKKSYEKSKDGTLLAILNNYENIDEIAFKNFLDTWNWSDDTINSIFSEMRGDGSRKANLALLAQAILSSGEKLDEITREKMEEIVTKAIDDGMTSITSASDYVTKGTTKYSDMTAFVKLFNEALPGALATIQDLFGYDKDAQGYVLDPLKYRDYLAGLKQMLQAMGESTEYIDGLILNANLSIYDAIDIKSFLDAENRSIGGEAREKLTKSLMNAGIWDSAYGKYESENAWDYIEAALSVLENASYVGVEMTPEELANKMAKDLKDINDSIRRKAAELMIQTIEGGGINAVNAMQAIATLQGKELTSADIESAYRAEVSKIENSFEQLITGPGGIVTGTAKTILETLLSLGKASITALDANNAVVNSITDIAAAYQEYYNLLAKSGEATLESLNNAKAKVLETKDGRDKEQKAIDALGDAAGMTYSTFGQLLTDMGIELTDDLIDELESSGITEAMGGNKMRIKNFAAFARRMNWDYNSEEYLSVFSAFNDNLVEQNAKNKKSVLDELSKLKEAKPGDLLNLTYTMSEMEKWAKSNKKSNLKEIKDAKKRLSKLNENTEIYGKTLDEILLLQAEDYMTLLSNSLVKTGAILSDGILLITDEANLLGISRILADAATNLGGTLGAELSDMVLSIIDSYTDVINKGIEGTLTNLEKTDLIKKGKDLGINLTADDFYESAEGFEMTTSAAIKAYTAMGQADTRAKKKIYKTLSLLLKDNNESYATATSMLSHIAELLEDINNLRKLGNDANEERINQLAEEVALAKEMHMYSLTHEDSTWNFMSNDAIPDSIDNALNYFANWGLAKTSLGEWSLKGVSDLNQFAALLQHVQEVADATTGSVEFMGTTVGKNGQITYDKFLDSIDKITKYNEKSGAWEIDNNSMLSVLGLNMNLGSKGITQNTKDAIDAYTQMNTKELEAFYEFGNGLVAVKKSLGNYSDVSFGHTFDDFITDGAFDYKRFMLLLGNTEGALEAFNAFAKNVFIDGNNFAELMASSEADFSDGSKNFAAAKSVITMALSEGWDMESDYLAIADLLSSTGFEGELTVGDTTFTVKEGRVITKFEKEGGAEYYDPYGGGPYETATDAWNAINTRELNDFAQLFDKYKNSEQTLSEIAFTVDGMTYTIKVKDDHYVIELDNGKGAKETSEAETINGAIANSKKQAEKVNQSIAELMSDAGWQEYITGGGDNYGQGRNFKFGKNLLGFITSDTRSVLLSSSFTSGAQLQLRALELWNDSGLSRKLASAQFKIETGIDIDPNTATESFNKINWDSYIKEADLTQTAADVASGMAAAFSNELIQLNLSNSISTGMLGAIKLLSEGALLEENAIPIEVKPQLGENPLSEILAALKDQKVTVEVELDMGALGQEGGNGKPKVTSQTTDLVLAVTPVVNASPEIPDTTVSVTPELNGNIEPLSSTATYTGIFPASAPTLHGTAIYTARVLGTPGLSGKGGCFIPGTLIIMSDYSTKNIENIQIGEYVIAYNDELKQFETRKVIKSYPHENTPRVLDITLSNGVVLGITPGHPILTTLGWKSRDIANSRYEHNTIADWLNIGDQVIGYKGNARVLAIKERVIPTHYTTYNIEVETCHTFVADGIVVHNAKATGTVGLAHAKSTLMGELGPELVVSNNRYFVVGQNGPEFVDLDEDAIVFNHLQTQSLLEKGMSNSRGKAVTNERKAVAYAHGSIHGGPAHDISTWTDKYRPGASNMWDNGTASVLSSAVGAAAEEISEAFIKTLDIWYNYLQEIAKLETQLSYEETLRSKLLSDFNKDGLAYYDSQTRSLLLMAKTIAVDLELITKQTEYQLKRYKEMVDAGNPFTAFYELDEDNQLRYKEGAEDRFNAIFSASKLTNAPYETLLEQYNWLINNGFGAYMEYDKEGKKIEVGGENDKNGSGMKSAIQAFVDKMEADREEMQGITDSINDAKSDVLEKQEQLNEILLEMRDNEIDLAEKVMDAIVDKMQRQIDEMTDLKEALLKANDDLIKGLSDTLSKEREMYDMQQSESDLESKRRRLAILQRSGGSASEINSLLAEIDTATKDLYFDKQQLLIDTILEASDAQIEKMEKLIEIAQESLDWLKKYGLLWDDVYLIMNSLDPNGIAATITEWNSDYWGKNPTELEKDLDDIRFSAGLWKAYSQDVNDIKNYLVALNLNKENTSEESSGTWKSDETGWWYEHDDGSYTKNDWEKIDDKWYYFNDQGYMHTGWHHLGNDWYYLRDQGDMHTGWHQEGNQWYYFGSDGKMVTGALTIDGVSYNFDADGKLGSSNTGSSTKNKKSDPSADWKGAKSINYDVNEEPWKKARGGYVKHGIYELGELGPETVLTAAQTKILRDNILSSRPNSLISLLKSYNDNYGHINDAVNKVEPSENNSVVIERAEVNMNVAQLANDYDAQRAGELALDRMLTIARKTQASNRIGR